MSQVIFELHYAEELFVALCQLLEFDGETIERSLLDVAAQQLRHLLLRRPIHGQSTGQGTYIGCSASIGFAPAFGRQCLLGGNGRQHTFADLSLVRLRLLPLIDQPF